MSFVDDFDDLCPFTICWQPVVARNVYGKPITYGATQTFRGRRSYKYSRVASYERGTKGQGPEAISESQIWILGAANVQYEDNVFVQGDTQPYPPVLSVQQVPDETGAVYTKIFLGSSNG